jgi:very-short-patch-repair endonuclease
MSVSETPDLLAIWHPERNTTDPAEITTGSTRKAWWRCPAGPDHEWEAALQSVAKSVASGKRGCPFCRGLRASVTNSVRSLMPLSAAQWHPTANGDLTPDDLAAGSNKPVWWQCAEGADHQWKTQPVQRRNRSDGVCPYCVSRRVSVTNSLALNAPAELLAQWHPDKNGALTPGDLVLTSQRVVWWQCPKGPDHVWDAPVHWRTTLGFGCPFCSGRRVSVTNSIRALMNSAVEMWHPTLNGATTPDDVLAGTSELVWWKCPEGPDHEWACAPVVLRRSLNTRYRGCPFCAGGRPSVTNSLANYPRLAAEVHPTRNGSRTPENIPAGSSKRIWWRCQTNGDHEWQASVVNRVRGRNCPFCKTSLRSLFETCLAYELQTIFDGINLNDDKINDQGKPIHVDILIPGDRIAIEVDGRYHHRDRVDADRRKSQRISATGWRHLRVREAPLEILNPEDVVVESDSAVKPAMNALLTRLLELGWVDSFELAIRRYLDEPEPRRLDEAIAEVQGHRNGRRVKIPGRVKGPNRDSRWESAYRHLMTFVDREGHARPSFEHCEDEHRLGSWVSVQRKRHQSGVLQDERASRLEQLPGWTWDPVADAFETAFAIYATYVQRNNNAYIPVGHQEGGINLGSWVRGIRRGRTHVTDNQRTRLESLPGWTAWDKNWTGGADTQSTLF